MKFQSQASVSPRKASVSHGDPLGLSVSLRKASVSHRGPPGSLANHRNTMGTPRKTIGKPWKNSIGIPLEYLAKPYENHRRTTGRP